MTDCFHQDVGYNRFNGVVACNACGLVITNLSVFHDGYYYMSYGDDEAMDGYETLSSKELTAEDAWEPVTRIGDEWLHPDYLEG